MPLLNRGIAFIAQTLMARHFPVSCSAELKQTFWAARPLSSSKKLALLILVSCRKQVTISTRKHNLIATTSVSTVCSVDRWHQQPFCMTTSIHGCKAHLTAAVTVRNQSTASNQRGLVCTMWRQCLSKTVIKLNRVPSPWHHLLRLPSETAELCWQHWTAAPLPYTSEIIFTSPLGFEQGWAHTEGRPLDAALAWLLATKIHVSLQASIRWW